MRYTAIGVLALFLTSCAVFESRPVNLTQPGLALHTEPGTMTYFLPTGRVHLQVTDMTDGTLTITTSVLYIPDLTKACLFRYQQNYFFDDQIKVLLTDNGLLSSVTSTSTDATPKIVAGLGQLAVNVMKIVATAGGGTSLAPQVQLDETIDPLNSAEVEQVNDLLKWIGVHLTVTLDGATGSGLPGFQASVRG